MEADTGTSHHGTTTRSVENQVSDAIADVSTSFYTMQSSLAQAEAARERLESSEALYRADKLQIEFLLDAQEELARVELQHAADQSRYALSLVNIHNVTGQLLAESGIYISAAGCQVGVVSQPSATPELPHRTSGAHCYCGAVSAASTRSAVMTNLPCIPERIVWLGLGIVAHRRTCPVTGLSSGETCTTLPETTAS